MCSEVGQTINYRAKIAQSKSAYAWSANLFQKDIPMHLECIYSELLTGRLTSSSGADSPSRMLFPLPNIYDFRCLFAEHGSFWA